MITTNMKVKTPIGEGVSQGNYAIVEQGTNNLIEQCVMVRIELTDQIRPHLGQAYCMTPHAEKSALFVFAVNEVTPCGY